MISTKRIVRFALGAILLPLCVLIVAEAQQPKKVPHIGYLRASSAAEARVRTDAFRKGLRDLGYVDRDNIIIEFRYADGKLERLPD